MEGTAKNNNSSPSESVVVPVGVAVLHSLVEGGCLPPLLNMLRSQYPIMIHEASLSLSLCLSVCKNLPGVLDPIDAGLLAQGVNNAAEKTVVNANMAEKTLLEAQDNSANAAKEEEAPESATSGGKTSESAVAADQSGDKSSDSHDKSSGSGDGDSAGGLSHAMYNLLVACVAISDIAGGVKILRDANIIQHFSSLRQSKQPHLSLAANSLFDKVKQ